MKRTKKKQVLLENIKNHKLYKEKGRSNKARDFIDKEIPKARKGQIFPGQLILFKYLNPKTKEELEYYDASPCTIFFGVFKSSLGKRVLGFNIHYFPTSIRYRIMNKIFELYRPIYQKYFESGLPKSLDSFDYQFLIKEITKVNLQFAVRMYDPKLISEVKVIAPVHWPVAIFTEGWFKKETRRYIIKLFKRL